MFFITNIIIIPFTINNILFITVNTAFIYAFAPWVFSQCAFTQTCQSNISKLAEVGEGWRVHTRHSGWGLKVNVRNLFSSFKFQFQVDKPWSSLPLHGLIRRGLRHVTVWVLWRSAAQRVPTSSSGTMPFFLVPYAAICVVIIPLWVLLPVMIVHSENAKTGLELGSCSLGTVEPCWGPLGPWKFNLAYIRFLKWSIIV